MTDIQEACAILVVAALFFGLFLGFILGRVSR